jgi:hypothetical protein
MDEAGVDPLLWEALGGPAVTLLKRKMPTNTTTE